MLTDFRVEPDSEDGFVFVTLKKRRIGYSVQNSLGFERVVVDEAIELVFSISVDDLEKIVEKARIIYPLERE